MKIESPRGTTECGDLFNTQHVEHKRTPTSPAQSAEYVDSFTSCRLMILSIVTSGVTYSFPDLYSLLLYGFISRNSTSRKALRFIASRYLGAVSGIFKNPLIISFYIFFSTPSFLYPIPYQSYFQSLRDSNTTQQALNIYISYIYMSNHYAHFLALIPQTPYASVIVHRCTTLYNG